MRRHVLACVKENQTFKADAGQLFQIESPSILHGFDDLHAKINGQRKLIGYYFIHALNHKSNMCTKTQNVCKTY